MPRKESSRSRENPQIDEAIELAKAFFRENAGEVPVDAPALLAEYFDVIVETAPLANRVSGTLINREHRIVLLSPEIPDEKKNFICAYFIGALLLEPEIEEIHYTDGVSYTGLEKAARKFAAELLMPEEIIKDMVDEGLDAEMIKLRVKCSEEAVRIRLGELRK